jgi:hypothetical protein
VAAVAVGLRPLPQDLAAAAAMEALIPIARAANFPNLPKAGIKAKLTGKPARRIAPLPLTRRYHRGSANIEVLVRTNINRRTSLSGVFIFMAWQGRPPKSRALENVGPVTVAALSGYLRSVPAAARKLAIIMHRLSVEGFLFGTRPPHDCAARKIAAPDRFAAKQHGTSGAPERSYQTAREILESPRVAGSRKRRSLKTEAASHWEEPQV